MPIQTILIRFKNLLFEPTREWEQIRGEPAEKRLLFSRYILFPAALLSALVLLLRWFSVEPLLAAEYGAVHFLSCIGGARITWWITREYLSGKTAGAENISLKLTIYSFFVFLVFKSLAAGLADTFLNDLMTVFSLLAVYVLYFGLKNLMELTDAQRTSALIVIGLQIVLLPALITQLLFLLLRLPGFNV